MNITKEQDGMHPRAQLEFCSQCGTQCLTFYYKKYWLCDYCFKGYMAQDEEEKKEMERIKQVLNKINIK